MRILTAVACVLGTFLLATSAQAERRVAFVVGNGGYRHVTPLPNPPIDARAMARLLRGAGFDVVEGIDLNRDAMMARLRDFAGKTQSADIALFYYAGHGISLNGKNYLIPVDADLKSEMDITFGAAVDVDGALDQTMSDAKVKLVFLDACRDNPFAAKIRSAARTRAITVSSGLAEMKPVEGTLIAFATGPGQTAQDGRAGDNSPFTRALLSHLTEPGVEIEETMKRVRLQVNEETQKQQLPWGHTNLTGSVYLNPVAAPAPAPQVALATPAPAAAAPSTTPATEPAAPAASISVPRSTGADAEIEFWRSVKETNKKDELTAYLQSFPNGQFRSLAEARLAALEEREKAPKTSTSEPIDPMTFTAEASQVTEDQIGLDKSKRTKVQKKLTSLGFDTKANGKFSDDTRQVITRWQTARNYPASGYLNKLQYQALISEEVDDAEPSGDHESGRSSSRHRERAERHSSRGRRYSGGGSSGPPGLMIHPNFGRGRSPFGGLGIGFGR